MAKGKSLHLGVNEVSPAAYGGWSGPLNACEADATDMVALASAAGFAGESLLTREATRANVLRGLAAAASELKSGDIFLVTYSGHGGQVPDRNNDEDDHLDETWCLYDGQLIDDELYECWSKFAPGVRVLVLSDSCHSGSVTRDALLPAPLATSVAVTASGTRAYGPRCLPFELVGRAYRAHQELYDSVQKANPKREADVHANVLLISGCQDPQTSMDGPFNGAFTGALLRTWNSGTFNGSYRSFHRKIQRALPLTQQPNLMTFGRGLGFAEQKPFTINA
jgi:hypothetical protein